MRQNSSLVPHAVFQKAAASKSDDYVPESQSIGTPPKYKFQFRNVPGLEAPLAYLLVYTHWKEQSVLDLIQYVQKWARNVSK